jgi:hypothetical protein
MWTIERKMPTFDLKARREAMLAPTEPAISTTAPNGEPKRKAVRPAVNVKVDVQTAPVLAGAGWWRRIPTRLWMVGVVLAAPVRALAMILDALVAATMLAVIAVVWAWWVHIIPDEDVARILGQLGGRGLSILSKSGII